MPLAKWYKRQYCVWNQHESTDDGRRGGKKKHLFSFLPKEVDTSWNACSWSVKQHFSAPRTGLHHQQTCEESWSAKHGLRMASGHPRSWCNLRSQDFLILIAIVCNALQCFSKFSEFSLAAWALSAWLGGSLHSPELPSLAHDDSWQSWHLQTFHHTN